MLQTHHRAFLGLPAKPRASLPSGRTFGDDRATESVPQVQLADKPETPQHLGRLAPRGASSKTSVSGAEPRQSRPIRIAFPLRHPGEEMIVNQARGGHRHVERVCGSEREAEVLEP